MRFLFALALCLLGPSTAFAGDWPAWVRKNPVPEPTSSEAEFTVRGVHQMLIDRQVKLSDNGHDVFTRHVKKVVGRLGLEEVGAIQIDFDPADEELIVHGVWRIRDGVRNKLEDLSFETIRRESEIDYGILDGRLTQYANIEDLRIGDIIDISWTRRVRPTVFPQYFLQSVAQQPILAFQVHSNRLLADKSRKIVINGPATPVVSYGENLTEYLWQHENTAPPDFDFELQDMDKVFGWTQVATESTWADVVANVQEAYAPQPLPPALTERLAAFEGNDAEKVTAAFRLVQDEIRYMGIQIGEGGFLPRPPKLVWSRRFGDCKDKALLLVSALTHMGIEADTVLVSSYDGDSLARYHPSPFLFDHAIVRVRAEMGDYFLDPTDVQQGGVGADIATEDFAWALPLSRNSEALVPVPGHLPEKPEYDVVARYEFQDEGEFAAELHVTTIYRGKSADGQRYKMAASGLTARAETVYEWYEDRYPGAETLTPTAVDDDLDANEFTIREHYGLTEAGLDEHRETFWLNPYATKNELDILPEGTLETEYELAPIFNRHRVEVSGLLGLKTPGELLISNKHFRFSREGTTLPNGFAAEYELQVLADAVHPDDAEEYRKSRNAKYNQQDWRLSLNLAKRVLHKPMLMGMTGQQTIASGGILIVLLMAFSACVVGYRRARAA